MLAAAISFGTVVATVPQARAWLYRIFTQTHEQYDSIHFLPGEESVENTGYWLPEWIPSGYELSEQHDMLIGWDLTFTSENDYIAFSVYPVAEGLSINVDNEHHTMEQITIQNRPALLYRETDALYGDILIWTDSSDTIAFCLSGGCGTDELIRMAESVTRVR